VKSDAWLSIFQDANELRLVDLISFPYIIYAGFMIICETAMLYSGLDSAYLLPLRSILF